MKMIENTNVKGTRKSSTSDNEGSYSRRQKRVHYLYIGFLLVSFHIIVIQFETARIFLSELPDHDQSQRALVSKNGDDDGDDKDEKGETNRTPQLQCKAYGGPSDEVATAEMVYWKDVPSDAGYVSPFRKEGDQEKYLLFEPDCGGWNNIRLALETVIVLAIAMGRTVVLPPESRVYLFNQKQNNQKNYFTFHDFFHLNKAQSEHAGLKFITMEEFLTQVAMKGKLASKPPGGRTNWDGQKLQPLWDYLRESVFGRIWKPDYCCSPFPSANSTDMENLEERLKEVQSSRMSLIDPTPVDAPLLDRWEEFNGRSRRSLCLYDATMQEQLAIHFKVENKIGARFLTPFYSFVFFEDWKQDTWMKRFVRDHIRYSDEVMCAAARVVDAIRKKARERNPDGNPNGLFNTFHIRRGDFQFKDTKIDIKSMYKVSRKHLQKNSTIFIATDERDRTFFDYLKDHYDIFFLDDFSPLLKGLNTNYFGIVDQLVAARGEIFWGTYYSTFTSYINRLRGYYSERDQLEGYEKGILQSYHFAPKEVIYSMTKYSPIFRPFWQREFPAGWRDIDKGIEDN